MQRTSNLFNLLPPEKAWARTIVSCELTLQSETALLTGATVTLPPTFRLTCNDPKLITQDRPNPHYVFSKDRVKWAKSLYPIYVVKFNDAEHYTFAPFIDLTALFIYQGLGWLGCSPQFFLHNEGRGKLAISLSPHRAFSRTNLLCKLSLAGAQFTMLYHGANHLTPSAETTDSKDLPGFRLINEAKNHHFGAMTVLMCFEATHIPQLVKVLQQHEPASELKAIPPLFIPTTGPILISDPDALNAIIQERFIDVFHAQQQYEKLGVLLKILTMGNSQAEFIDEFIELDFKNPVYPIRFNTQLIMFCIQLKDVFRDLELFKLQNIFSDKEITAFLILKKSMKILQNQLKYYHPFDFLMTLFPTEEKAIQTGYRILQAEQALPSISTHRNAFYYRTAPPQENNQNAQAKPAPH